MSKDIFKSKDNNFHITSFYGGKNKGRCVQFTMHEDYTQHTKEEIKEIINVLNEWLEK